MNLNFQKKAPLWGLFLLVIILGGWVFKDLSQFQLLLYDDVEYITYREGEWGGGYWQDLFLKPVANLWHPLTVLSHDFCASWTDGWLWKHHAFNIVLHVANACLVIWWLLRLGSPLRLALAVPILWFFHPVLVEPVAWVSARKDLLVTFFSLLALILTAKPVQGLRPRGLLFFLVLGALLSKPVAVVLPLVLVFQRLALSGENAWSEKALHKSFKNYGELFFLSAGVVLITLIFQSDGGQSVIDGRSLLERFASALWAGVKSLRLWFVPHDLHTAYDDPEHINVIFVVFGFITMVTLVVMSWWSRFPWTVRLGLALFLLFLLPTMGFVRAGNHLVADRYLYLPGLGLTLALAGALSFIKPRLFIAFFMVLTIGSAGLSKHQREHWRNTKSVFLRVLDIEPRHSYALAQVGALEKIAGNTEQAKSYCLMALAEDPGSPVANWNLGDIAIDEGDFSSAYQYYMILADRWGGEAWVHKKLAKLAWNLHLSEDAKTHAQQGMKYSKTKSERNDFEVLLNDFEFK